MRIGFMCRAAVNDGASQANSYLDELVEATFGGSKWGKKEVTKLRQVDSNNNPDKLKRFISTLEEATEFKLTAFYTPKQYARVRALGGKEKFADAAKTPQRWTFECPDPDGAGTTNAGDEVSASYSFDGWVTEVGDLKAGREDEMAFDIMVHRNGPITAGYGTGGSDQTTPNTP